MTMAALSDTRTDIGAHGNQNLPKPFSALVGASLIAPLYVVAINVTNPGAVALDEFHFWLLGLLPWFAAIALVSLNFSSESEVSRLTKCVYMLWPLTLAVYVISHITYFAHNIDGQILEFWGYGRFGSSLLISVFYVACIQFAVIALLCIAQRSFATVRKGKKIFPILFLINTVSLSALVIELSQSMQ